jgi:uncharacterized repeat protein (TIGR01451 family)
MRGRWSKDLLLLYTHGAKWVDGKYGKALSFDGVDNYVEVPHPGYLAQGTIEGWVYYISVSASIPSHGWMWFTIAGNPINQRNDGVDFGVHPYYSQNLVFGIYDSGWRWADSGIRPQSGKWYHFAGTWGSGGIKIYIDGILQGQNSYTGGIPSYTKYTYLGANTYGGYVNTIVDEVSIYNRALTADEIKEHYEGKQTELTLTKSASPSTIQEGETTTISIRVENTGTGDAKSVEVGDTIPPGFKIISGSKSESFGEIKPGDYRTSEYTLKATGSGKFTCDPATATFKDADGNSYSAASNSMSILVGGEVPVGADSDGDGWSDEKEREMGTNPYSIDSDGDGLKDPEDPNPTVPEEKKKTP